MGLGDKLRNMFTIPDDGDEDDVEQQDMIEEPVVNRNRKSQEYDDYDEAGGKKNKVVNIHATTQLQVVLVKPEAFQDASAIADHLNEKRTVVLNLESAGNELARRLVDFLSGVAYANNGQIKRVANNTFIITPYNVDIVGDLLDELENSGVYF